MIHINEKNNLLEEKIYTYSLQNVEKPQLYRDVFDYQSIPKIIFNNRHVPMGMPKDIWITDTTFRDGQQSTSPFTVLTDFLMYPFLLFVVALKSLLLFS